MKKLFLAICFSICLIKPGLANNTFSSQIDSLIHVLEQKDLSRENRVLTLNQLAHAYRAFSLDSAESVILRAIKLAKPLSDEYINALLYRNFAITLYMKGKYNEAFENYIKAMKIWKKEGDLVKLSEGFAAIGETFRAKADYEKSLEYLNKALNIARRIHYVLVIKNVYQRIAAVYYELQKPVLALKYADSSLHVKDAEYTPEFLANIYNIMGASYQKLGDYEKSFKYLKSALKYLKDIGLISEQPSVINNIASNYIQIHQYDSALTYAHKSLALALRTGVKTYQQIACYFLAKAFEEKGTADSALFYYKKYSDLRWELFEEEKAKAMAEMEARYNLHLKEVENKALKLHSNIQKKVISTQKIVIILTIILIIILAIVPFVMLKQHQKLKKSYVSLKDQQDKIEAQNIELSDLNQTKDKMLSIIAHDLKNPFHSIQGFSEILLEELKQLGREDLIEYAMMINQGVENLNILLNNLLDWSRMQSGSIQLNPEPIDIPVIIEENLKLFKANISDKNLQIEKNILTENKAIGDRLTISTVIRNLISNAVKFTNQGGKISFTVLQENNRIKVIIKDTGVGIAPEDLKKLFTREKKISRGTRNEKGSGLGLDLCRDFLKLNGGELNVKSKVGEGTEMIFDLPVSEN